MNIWAEVIWALLAFIKTADTPVFVYSATRWTVSVVRPFGTRLEK